VLPGVVVDRLRLPLEGGSTSLAVPSTRERAGGARGIVEAVHLALVLVPAGRAAGASALLTSYSTTKTSLGADGRLLLFRELSFGEAFLVAEDIGVGCLYWGVSLWSWARIPRVTNQCNES
jgi:hypothetical protein